MPLTEGAVTLLFNHWRSWSGWLLYATIARAAFGGRSFSELPLVAKLSPTLLHHHQWSLEVRGQLLSLKMALTLLPQSEHPLIP